MNTDFIKWMCDKAEGFDFDPISERVQIHPCLYVKLAGSMYNRVVYPLLLQRAIEGVNSCGKWKVSQNHLAIEIYMTGCAFNVEAYEIVSSITPDNAKQSALLYIYEQEQV